MDQKELNELLRTGPPFSLDDIVKINTALLEEPYVSTGNVARDWALSMDQNKYQEIEEVLYAIDQYIRVHPEELLLVYRANMQNGTRFSHSLALGNLEEKPRIIIDQAVLRRKEVGESLWIATTPSAGVYSEESRRKAGVDHARFKYNEKGQMAIYNAIQSRIRFDPSTNIMLSTKDHATYSSQTIIAAGDRALALFGTIMQQDVRGIRTAKEWYEMMREKTIQNHS